MVMITIWSYSEIAGLEQSALDFFIEMLYSRGQWSVGNVSSFFLGFQSQSLKSDGVCGSLKPI